MKKIVWIAGAIIALVGAQSASANGPITVQKGDEIRYDYTLRVDGKVIETTDSVLAEANNLSGHRVCCGEESITVGSGSMPTSLEDTMIGMTVGSQKTITLPPYDGYTTGSLEKTSDLISLVKKSKFSITAEEANPYHERTYDMDDFAPQVQKRIRVGAKIFAPYSRILGVVKSIETDTGVTLGFYNKSHPFYNKKVVVGLTVQIESASFTVERINSDGSILFAVTNPNAPLSNTDLAIGKSLQLEVDSNPIIITGYSDTEYRYIPADNLIGKTLEYTIKLNRINRSVKSSDGKVVNTFESRLREEWDN